MLVGYISLYISQIRGNAQIQAMSHLVMVNRLPKKKPNWVKQEYKSLAKLSFWVRIKSKS
jgi:hypothetical protein